MVKRRTSTPARKRKTAAQRKRVRSKTPARKKPVSLSGRVAAAIAGLLGAAADAGRMRDKLSRRGDSETE